jgi:hypothetical protein
VFPDGLFKGDAVFASPDPRKKEKELFEAIQKKFPDGLQAAEKNLRRLALFKGLHGDVIMVDEINKYLKFLEKGSSCKNTLMRNVNDKLSETFGLELREKYKRKKPKEGKGAGVGAGGKKKRKKSSSQTSTPGGEIVAALEGTKSYYVVNALAPAPLVGRAKDGGEDDDDVVNLDDEDDDEEGSSSLSSNTGGMAPANAAAAAVLSDKDIAVLMNNKSELDVAKGRLCDSHRRAIAAPLGDTVHAERGLLVVVMSLIRNGKKDAQGRFYLNEDILFAQLQDVFRTNIQKAKSRTGSGEDHHEFLGSVRTKVSKTFVARDYIRKGDDPSIKDRKSSAYWIGQRAVHEVGMPSLFEFMTQLTDRAMDTNEWKRWAEEDLVYA